MEDISVINAMPSHQSEILQLMARSFREDTEARWLFPDEHQYARLFPEFVRLYGGSSIDTGSCDYLIGKGVAMWLPPGSEPEDAELNDFLENSLPGSTKDDLKRLLEKLGQLHPQGPHWYLTLFGVDPGSRRRGYGAAMMSHALTRSDSDSMPAYLETSNPANVTFYERLGFQVLGYAQIGRSPTYAAMARMPQ